MSIHTDQATVDRWLADGQWVQFAPGSYSDDLRTRTRQMMQREGVPQGTTGNERPVTDAPMLPPADWKPEPCETCRDLRVRRTVPCPGCNDSGVQRLAVTVPCDHPDHENVKGGMWLCAIDGPPHDDTGRITVAWATVEWGPLPVYSTHDDRDDNGVIVGDTGAWLFDGKHHPLTLPPDIDPASLVGQWARGGTIEVAT